MDGIFSVAGFIVGILVGMTGVGGGALMTPLLVLGFGVPALIAVGTDLLFAAITKTVGTISHGWQGSVQWPIVGLLALGSLPASIITLQYLSDIQQQTELMEAVIRSVLGFALLLTAFLLLFRQKLLECINTSFIEEHQTMRRTATVLAGGGLGFIVTISSIGAGALCIVILAVLYPKLKTTHIIGTDIAHAVPLTVIAGVGHFQLGNVDTSLLFYLLLGSIPGVILGSQLSERLPETVVRVTLASILFGVSLKLFY